LTHLWTRAKN